jgi:RAD3-like DEAD/DEAH box helicase
MISATAQASSSARGLWRDGQFRRVFRPAHRDVRLNVGDAVEIAQALPQPALIARQVRRLHPQQVIGWSREQVALLDPRLRGDGSLELLGDRLPLALERHVHERIQLKTDGFRIDDRDVALDDAILAELSDPSEARCGGQADAVGELVVGELRVALQLPKDQQIGSVTASRPPGPDTASWRDRFDGMDFNADECRLVVLATQPRAINPQEAFAADYLRDAGFMMQRLNQRILQALGRCNRAEDDFGVYLLVDRRFAAHFSQKARRRGLPPNVQAEIDLAENHTELSTPELVDYVEQFLRQDFVAFDAELAEAVTDLPTVQPPELDDSTAEVIGWLELHGRQDYRSAEGHFRARQEACGARGLRELGAFAQRWPAPRTSWARHPAARDP